MSDSEDEEPRDFSTLIQKARHVRAKDSTPNNSDDQQEALNASRDALFTLIGEERRASAKSISKGIFDRNAGLVKLTQPRGIHLRVMGHAVEGKVSLYLEEAAWLHSMRLLEATDQDGGRVLDMPDYYSMAFGGDDGWISFEKYQTYAYLRRLGYIVRRTPHHQHSSPEKTPSPAMLSSFWSFVRMVADMFRRIMVRLFGTRPLGTWHSPSSVLRITPASPWYKPFASKATIHHTSEQPQFHYDVYKPNPNWKKRDPGVPDFRVVVTGARDAAPTLIKYQALFTELAKLPMPSKSSYPRIRYTRSSGSTMAFLMAIVDEAEGVSFMNITGDGAVDLAKSSSS